MLTRLCLVVSLPLWQHSHHKVGAITAPFSVVVKEIDGIGCRFVSEDGVFTLADFGNFHIYISFITPV